MSDTELHVSLWCRSCSRQLSPAVQMSSVSGRKLELPIHTLKRQKISLTAANIDLICNFSSHIFVGNGDWFMMKISVIGIMRGLFHVVKFIFLGVNCLKGLFTQKWGFCLHFWHHCHYLMLLLIELNIQLFILLPLRLPLSKHRVGTLDLGQLCFHLWLAEGGCCHGAGCSNRPGLAELAAILSLTKWFETGHEAR